MSVAASRLVTVVESFVAVVAVVESSALLGVVLVSTVPVVPEVVSAIIRELVSSVCAWSQPILSTWSFAMFR